MVLLSHFNDVSLGTCFPDQLQNNGRHQRYIYIGMFSISMVCSWKLHGMAILLYNNLLMFSLKLGYSYVWVCTRYYTVKCFSIGNLRSKAFCQKFYQRLWHIYSRGIRHGGVIHELRPLLAFKGHTNLLPTSYIIL